MTTATTAINDTATELIADIDRLLAGGMARLRFSTKLEDRFLSDTAPGRSKRYTLLGLIAIVLYNIFNITDRLMLPDVYQEAWVIRMAIVTPMMVLAIGLARLPRMARYLDLLAMILILLSCISLMVIFSLSRHANAIHYVTGIVLSFMFISIVVRMRFWYTLVSAVVIFVSAVPAVMSLTGSPLEIQINSLVELGAAMIISLIANYQMEYEARREYLRTLRETLRASALSVANAELSRLAAVDTLTGLASRRSFDQQMALAWEQARQLNRPLSLIYIDVDHFKRYNDHYGHPTGDQCLIQIGQAIRTGLQRNGDLAARYGGEEFVVLLRECGPDDALIVARRIRQAMTSQAIPHADSPTAAIVTLSLGIAGGLPGEFKSSIDLFEAADHALYQAKADGRNRVVIAGRAAGPVIKPAPSPPSTN
ncbi:diguanylate cyclase [Chitinivorax sp. B]|uniref:GGDEF domain-containing protein n=1 Tax=Chitinivorax sp. B TaxID=2502235 RepID=UPI0014853125|nr:diguanylate cyclase [Chitinivorax sp. B]